MRQVISTFLLGIIIMLCANCATTQSRWKDENFRKAVESYWDLPVRPSKEKRIEKVPLRTEAEQWQNAQSENTILAHKRYLQNYPDGPHKDEARQQIEILSWEKARDTHTIKAYEEIIKQYPQGIFTGKARQRLDSLKTRIQELEQLVKRVISPHLQVKITSVSRFPQKPELSIAAHLLKGHAVDENSPYVRGDYSTNEKLERLVQIRCARILKAIAGEEKIPEASKIVIRACHGVRQQYFPGGFGGTDVAMTLYQVSIPVKNMRNYDLTDMREEDIMDLWSVTKNIIPSLQIQVQFGWK